MYIYIDESGNFGWPFKATSEPYMIFSLLVIHDLKSKQVISHEVSRAIVDLKKHHPSCKNDPNKRILELRGSKELNDCPNVRLRFFKRIIKKASFSIYAIVLDKRLVSQKFPENYMERYSLLLLNILYSVPITKNQKWVTMVVDSQAKALPTRPVKVRYSSKNKRLQQKIAKEHDKNRRNQYTQMITRMFKNSLKKYGTHLHVWHVRSNDDRCLQAADVISHFLYEGERMNEYIDERRLIQKLPLEQRNLIFLSNDNRWRKIKVRRNIYTDTYDVLKPTIGFIRRPKYLLRKKLVKLKRRHILHEKNTFRGNREA